jgi:beta-N-acetylhexosaminidase
MGLSTQDAVGQRLVVGLPGPELTPAERDLLTEVRPGGVILFARNLVDAEQTARLCREIRSLFRPAPFLAVDQEGGRVSRLSPPFPALPAAGTLGRLEMVQIARWFGALTGRGLRSLGFHADYAPVADLSRPGNDDGIGDRAFGPDPEAAAARAGAFLDGLADAGVAGCLKHFPGLGGAPADTHERLPRMPSDPETRRRGLTPFRLLSMRTPMVMVSHAHYPDLSGEDPVPASLDRRVVTGLLRREVGYGGVVVSDDLEMGAVAGRAGMDELAVAAAAAGCDQLLVCHRADRIRAAWRGLGRALEGGDLDPAESDAALARIAALKASPALARPEEPFEPDELALVIEEMTDLSGEVERALRRRDDTA